MSTSAWFAKAAAVRELVPHGDFLAKHSSELTAPAGEDTDEVAAVKMAASLMDAIKLLGRSANSHLLGSALYAPLVAADLSEMRHQRRSGKSGILPALAGTALAVMMAQHAAPLLEKAVQRPAVQSVLKRIGIGAK